MHIIPKILGLLVCLVMIAYLFITITKFSVSKVNIPNIEVLDLEGNKFEMSSFIGQPLILNFWSTWCPPCIKEKPYLERARPILAAEGFKIVVLSPESIPTIQQYKDRHDYGFTYLKMVKDYKLYGIFNIPHSYIVNAKGEIVHSQGGFWAWDEPANIDFIKKAIQ